MRLWIAILISVLSLGCGGGEDGGAVVPLADLNGDGEIRILAFGDSITRGIGDGSSPGSVGSGYPSRIAGIAGVLVVNDGRSGELTQDGVRRLPRGLQVHRPDFVVLLEGVNNVTRSSSGRVVSDLQTMVGQVIAAGAFPLLGTLTPTCCNHAGSTPFGAIQAINAELRAFAAENAIQIVDFEAAFAPRGSFDPASGVIHAPEGLHPTPSGYDLMAAVLADLFGFSAPRPDVSPAPTPPAA